MKLRYIRQLGNRVLSEIGDRRRDSYDLERTIVLSGTGRSGTTWLAQLMSTIPGSVLLWEQLQYKTNSKALEYGFGHPRYLPVGYDGENELAYIRYLLTGGDLRTGVRSHYYFKPWNLLRFKLYLHKFVNANMLLPWMTKVFGIRTVYIIRHPCAVVSSQLRHGVGAWDDFSKTDCCHETLFNEYPHLGALFDQLNTHEECLAFDWAIQNFVPLKQGFDGITVFYEDLAEDPAKELERIFSYLGIVMPKGMSRKIYKPSKSVFQSSNNLVGGKANLSGWQTKLEERQINGILNVVSNAGVDLYDLNPVPLRRTLIS